MAVSGGLAFDLGDFPAFVIGDEALSARIAVNPATLALDDHGDAFFFGELLGSVHVGAPTLSLGILVLGKAAGFRR